MTAKAPTKDNTRWIIVGMSFLALGMSFLARNSLGLMMADMEKTDGWSRGFMSSAGAVMLIFMAITSPVAGNLVDRIGARKLLTAGLICVALGLIGGALSPTAWVFIATFGVLGGIGFGIVANHVVSTVIAFYFVERRGLATGIASAGSTAGQLIMIPILAATLSAIGWRWSYIALAAVTLALILLVLRYLDGGGAAVAQARAAAREPIGKRVGFLFRSWPFHGLFWGFLLCGFTTAGVIEVHFLPFAASCGFPVMASAAAYGVLSAFNLGGMVLSGYLTDRINRSVLLGGIYAIRAATLLLLFYMPQEQTLLFVFAVAFGLVDYASIPPTAGLVARRLGLPIMGLAMGIISAGHAAGAAFGALMGGVLYDLFAQYNFLWVAAIGVTLVGAVFSWTVRDIAPGAPTGGQNATPVPAAA